jgi:hypothetical protein
MEIYLVNLVLICVRPALCDAHSKYDQVFVPQKWLIIQNLENNIKCRFHEDLKVLYGLHCAL